MRAAGGPQRVEQRLREQNRRLRVHRLHRAVDIQVELGERFFRARIDRSVVHEFFRKSGGVKRVQFRFTLLGEPAELLEEPVTFWIYKITGLLERDHLRYLQSMAHFLDACKLSWPGFLAAADRVWGEAYNERPPVILTEKGIFGVRRAMKKVAAAAALTSVARTAVAVEQYRRLNHELPNDLAELATDYLNMALEDPFTGQPLRYKKLAKGYVVYSIGEDGGDDGGDEKKDITFTVER